MKNGFILSFIATVLLFYCSCKKQCFQCHNVCKTCQYQYPDTTLTMSVCSDKLSEAYYIEYIDSLTSPSLGWTCTDAGSNYEERFCESESKNNYSIIVKKEAGLVCTQE
jgi:hypothetical protein